MMNNLVAGAACCVLLVANAAAAGCADAALVECLPASFLTEPWCAGIASRFDAFAVRRA